MNGSRIPQYLDDLKRKWPNLASKYVRSDSFVDPLSLPRNPHTSGSSWQVVMLMLWKKILALFGFLLGWWTFIYVDAETKPITSNAVSTVIHEDKRILDSIEDTRKGIDRLHLSNRQREVLKWLNPPDPSTHYNKALQQRHGCSGLWFLQSNAFAKWKIQPDSFLWLNGIPGCGKTILSSAILKDLLDTLPFQPLYFYFDFNDTGKQTFDSMLRSLINQLCCKCEDTWKPLDLLFSSHQDGRVHPSYESLRKVLLEVIGQVEQVWIVLDAVDECSTRSGPPTEGLLSWMRDLTSQQKNVHLLVTSRPEQDIKSEIVEWASLDNIVPIRGDGIDDDIRAYVHTRVREDKGLKRWRTQPDVQEEIEHRLMEKADGMFRWATCQLDALENCLEYRTLQKALKSLPKTLDETYSRVLHSIPSEYKQNAFRILQFLTYSARPLSVSEMVDAIAVDTEGEDYQYFDPKHRMPDPREITCFCSSLIVFTSTTHNSDVDNKDDDVKLQLAHFSVKEYLISGRLDKDLAHNFEECAARASIATVCLAYLLHLNKEISVIEIREKFPLAQYSARYWMDHAAITEGKDETLERFIVKIFYHNRDSLRNCYSLYQPDQTWFWTELKGQCSALYYASYGGLVNAVKYILSQGANVNAHGGIHGNALHVASLRGHEKVVELLLRKGADISAQGGSKGTALHMASSRGHEKIVELLLRKGANINAQVGHKGTALRAAIIAGCKEIIELLLRQGADINAQDGSEGTTLHATIVAGYKEIIELLLRKGADIHSQVRFYNTALHAAIVAGHEEIVELLLREGANVHLQDGLKGNALQMASYTGHDQIVKLLLDYGADVNVRDGIYSNALQVASYKGHEQVVKLLLENGADINQVKGGLHKIHERVVKLLLENGADINQVKGGLHKIHEQVSFCDILNEHSRKAYISFITNLCGVLEVFHGFCQKRA
ncbi:hypothetical protein UA08_07438 [Talaromyces atroroseus]|uniref:Uncharacterized protein n=1 Tax=Talaromyces atroroseus TaxID=1441469 RepID=A0A225AAX6_TALAT|nr:hypothetical protein UA08_07438 [Talaromyces atroroseus]OKL57360.1 hypothetical protein UA08_07438 [Talaromyces atroroseus]